MTWQTLEALTFIDHDIESVFAMPDYHVTHMSPINTFFSRSSALSCARHIMRLRADAETMMRLQQAASPRY